MYEAIKEILLDLFRAPSSPPDSPAGAHDSIQVFRASPRYLTYQTFFLSCAMVLLCIVLFIFGILLLTDSPVYGSIACLLLGLLWVIIFISVRFVIRLEYDMRYYIITDRSLRIRKGVWTIVEQTLTFINIQNITVEQGPLERFFGISRVVVETAGGGGSSGDQPQGVQTRNYHRAVLDGLENAGEIRDLMIHYLKAIPPSGGLGLPDEVDQSRIGGTGFSPKEILALREILTETKSLRSLLIPH